MYTNDLYLENNYEPELSLGNNYGYTINENKIHINVDKINNNRDKDNISGSLSIELWALPEFYDGSHFSNAHCMTSVDIGEIYGQHFLENCQYDLTLDNPPAGVWNLCLMLREFNGIGYETKDYRNFNVPYFVDLKSNIVSDNVVSCNIKEESKCINELETYNINNKKIVKKTTPKVTKSIEKISLNSASESDIVKIKGVSKNLASLIVANRPYKSTDELLKVKGVGKKLLENILEQAKI